MRSIPYYPKTNAEYALHDYCVRHGIDFEQFNRLFDGAASSFELHELVTNLWN